MDRSGGGGPYFSFSRSGGEGPYFSFSRCYLSKF